MTQEIRDLEEQRQALRVRLSEARKAAPSEPVEDAVFAMSTGQVMLSDLFGDYDDLIVIHNMGVRCRYCTLWADGLNAFVEGIMRRAGIVLISPDEPPVQDEVRLQRGWKFSMASDTSGEFTRAMGYLHDDSEYWPGVSGFKKLPDGKIVRTGTAAFGPGDDFCPVWPLFDLIGGEKDWEPK